MSTLTASGNAVDYDHASLLQALQNPDVYPHPVEAVSLIETHISWILLTGRYAYKLKKPVNLGFLDFTTLEKRRFYCREELRLNRRLAPSLYVDVVAIRGTCAAPLFSGPTAAIEYAVKMREFPQSAQLDRMLEAGLLTEETIESAAVRIARFHDMIPVAGEAEAYGTPELIMATVRENFEQTLALVGDSPKITPIEDLADWCEKQYAKLSASLASRHADGFVRECHGDMHLSNLVALEDDVTAFDCIEFSPALRWIDVIDDVAFLMMDLLVRQRPDLAYRFMNTYLANTGDYAGLQTLRFYLIHRSMVRAKIAILRSRQADLSREEREFQTERFDDHVALARELRLPAAPPALILASGLSGSGKTWLSHRLAPRVPAFRIHSDLERKRLFGLEALADSGSRLAGGLYSHNATEQTYQQLLEQARIVLASGFSVIVDATFGSHAQRLPFRALADELGVTIILVACEADDNCLRERICHRAEGKTDASEADLKVLEYQKRIFDPLDRLERELSIRVDTRSQDSADALTSLVNQIDAKIQETNTKRS